MATFSDLPTDTHNIVLLHCNNITKCVLKNTNKYFNDLLKKEKIEVAATEIVTSGCLNLLKWVKENKCPWNEESCATAAENGNLKMLKWLRENGCDWNHKVCEAAIDNCNIEMLNWAMQNGCDFDPYYIQEQLQI